MLDPQEEAAFNHNGRQFMKAWKYYSPAIYQSFESEQELKLPQPPLVKAPMRPGNQAIDLPRDFEALNLDANLYNLLLRRKSSRHFSQKGVSLLQLSFMLWASQGIRGIRGKSYASLRTVPSGGARHAFETYLIVQNVASLQPGLYHYLPLYHQLEYLATLDQPAQTISTSLSEQSWAAKADLIFYWSCVPHRAEWRYGISAHRVVLIDAGHITQNLYLACAALGLGTCAVAAYDQQICDALFELDGDDEFTVYAAPVGTISAADSDQEKAFYQFVEDEGL
jgi:SagB-type dehydrogenase family enzyme